MKIPTSFPSFTERTNLRLFRVTLLIVVAFLLSPVKASDSPPKLVDWSCLFFRLAEPTVVLKGTISLEEYTSLFSEDCLDTGGRLEIPEDAGIIGELSVRAGKIPTLMPIYRWSHEGTEHWLCQSTEMGKAPRFRAYGRSEQTFLDDLRSGLRAFGEPIEAEGEEADAG